MERLLFVSPLYWERFLNPSTSALLSLFTSTNKDLIPSVYLRIFFRPPPSPLDTDLFALENLFIKGIPLENFCMSALNAPDAFLIAPDARVLSPEPTPEISFFNPPQPFEPIAAALLRALPNTGIRLRASAAASFISRIRDAVCRITAPAVWKLFPSESLPVYGRSVSVFLNCMYRPCAWYFSSCFSAA